MSFDFSRIFHYPRICRLLLIIGCSTLFFQGQVVEASQKPSLLGEWRINAEETERLKPKLSRSKTGKSGFGGVGVSVAGMPLPGRSGSGRSRGTASMPKVLSCSSLALNRVGDDIQLTCPDFDGSRKFKIGTHHGRKVRFSNSSLSEKYSSTSRRVTHAFKLKKRDRMEVEVTVNPKQSAKLRYLLVYDRVAQTNNEHSKSTE